MNIFAHLRIISVALLIIASVGCNIATVDAGGKDSDGEPTTPQRLVMKISEEARAIKADILSKHSQQIAKWKEQVHQDTGISRYHAYQAVLSSEVQNDYLQDALVDCYIAYIKGEKTPQEIEDDTLLPDWFTARPDTAYANFSFVLKKLLGITTDFKNPINFASLIAVGPYRPMGYIQDGVINEEVSKKYASDEYLITEGDDGLYIAHLSSVEELLRLNDKDKILKLFGVTNTEDLIKHFADNGVWYEDLEKQAFAVVIQGEVGQGHKIAFKLTPELAKLRSLHPGGAKKDIRLLAYQLDRGDTDLAGQPKVGFIKTTFTCKWSEES